MIITQRLRKYVRKFLKAHNTAEREFPHCYSLESALGRQGHVPIRTVIDVGASNGCWSERVMPFYPNAEYFLIEAQSRAHGKALENYKKKHKNVDYVIAAAGDRMGTIYFDASDPFGGQASEIPFPQGNTEVRMTTVDREVAARYRGPFLLKLDTHGFELPILEGSRETLRSTSLIILEVYNFRLIEGCLRFHEMCTELENRGFRCIDLFEIMHRPKDQVLWQMDMVFAPNTRPEFASNTYQ